MDLSAIDLTTAGDDELVTLAAMVAGEQHRRRVLADAPRQAEQIAEQVYAAKGGDGRPFRQPHGGHDAYPLGAVVVWNGGRYRSTQPSNAWSPGERPSGWEVADGPAPGDPPAPPAAVAWAPGQLVAVGDARTYNGATYVCVQPHTTQADWTPPAVPALWSPQA